MVSVVMIGTFSMMMLTSTNLFNNNQQSVQRMTVFEQESRNKVLALYEESDWQSLTKDIINTPAGDLTVEYTHESPTRHYTESLKMTIRLDNIEEEFTLERSVIGNE